MSVHWCVVSSPGGEPWYECGTRKYALELAAKLNEQYEGDPFTVERRPPLSGRLAPHTEG